MTHPMQSLLKLPAALLLCGLAAHASAAGTVVLDSYGPGDDPYGWPTSVFANASGRQDAAVTFTLSSATSIESILTSLDGTGGVTLGIRASLGSVPGSTWLYSTHLVNPVMNTTFTPTGWTLPAGTYWLTAVADNGFSGQWQSGTDDYSGNWASADANGWTAVTSTLDGMPAARITVTSAVPEPSTYGLMFAGGLIVAAVARRKANARQQG